MPDAGPTETRVMRGRVAGATLRVLLAVAAVVLAVLTVQLALTRGAQHRDLRRLVEETGLRLRQPDVARAAVSDPDPVRGRLAIARALLAEASDYGPFAKLPARERAEAAGRIGERLELARELAAAALAARPGDWQAAMILGGATYRLWSSRGDPSVFSERSRWEGPLTEAGRLAPGEDEPWRLLAVAWLEIWPTLDAAERRNAQAVLSRAFRDPATFARCAELWLATTQDRAVAFSLVPDESRAWSHLEGVYAGRGDWDSFCAARSRRDEALTRELQQRVVEVGERLRGGDRSGARSLAAGIVDSAPAELRFAPSVEGALALCPPGLVGSREAVRRWLAWVTDGFVRGRQPFSTRAVARLLASAGTLPSEDAALGALAAGDLVEAERLERRADAPATEAWAPYWIAKAQMLAGRGGAHDGAVALAKVQRDSRAIVPAVEARLAVARAGGSEADVSTVQAELASLASTSWPPTAWRWRSGVARLDLLCGIGASGLEVSLDVAPPAGAVVRVGLDGATAVVSPARSGRTLPVEVPIPAGAHLLEVETIAGERVVPGQVVLVAERK